MPTEPLPPDATARAHHSRDTSAHASDQAPVKLSELESAGGCEPATVASGEQPWRIEFGRVAHSASLDEGSIVVFDSGGSQEVDVYQGDRHIARGMLVASDGRVGVRLVQLMDQRAEAA